MPSHPWEKYAVKDIDGDDVTKVWRLYHVAHVDDARRILEDRRINPELVRDESVLNRSRICVVWTSPNTWHAGSLYGNVSFTFPLSTLNERNFYWVEAMTAYNPTALRILISANEVVSTKVVQFDPLELGHPLHRSKDGKWLRLNDYNYELMFDESFDLDECERIDFFDHHGQICNKHRRSTCPDVGRVKSIAAARIAAVALASDEPEQLSKLLLAPDDDSLVRGLARIGVWLMKRSYPYGASSRELRDSLFAAAMRLYAYDHMDHAKATIGGLGSKERALKALLRRVKEVFGDDVLMKLEHELELQQGE